MMRGKRVELSDEQRRWLVEHYADTSNAECMAAIGMSPNQWRSLRRIASSLGLEKSREYMAACQRHTAECAAKANRYFGNAGAANLVHGARFRYRKGHNPRGTMDDEKWEAMLQKRGATRKAIFAAERRRVLFGLEQKTKLKVTREPSKVTWMRYYLRRKGYEIARGSKVATITEKTRRASLAESRARELNFKFVEQ